MKVLKTVGFWLVSVTWGSIMTFIGALVALVCLVTGHKPHKFGHSIYFEVGSGWGGVELGAFFLVSKPSSLGIKQHEFGHGIQNLIFGPLMPFIVCLPSALRYHVRNYKTADTKVYFLAGVIGSISILASVPLLIVANVCNVIWPLILMSFILVYGVILFIWQMKEIRRFMKNGKEEPYDSAWFEGWATRLGEKLMPDERVYVYSSVVSE